MSKKPNDISMSEREAAERRRRHKEARVAAESPYYDDGPSPSWPYSWQLDKDARELADAYLRDNPADSDEAITEEWLRSVGFTVKRFKASTVLAMHFKSHIGDSQWLEYDDGRFLLCRWSPMYDDGMPPDRVGVDVSTRGELRALCRVLKIPLHDRLEAKP